MTAARPGALAGVTLTAVACFLVLALAPSVTAAYADGDVAHGCARLSLREPSNGKAWHLKLATETGASATAACADHSRDYTPGDTITLHCTWLKDSLLAPSNPQFVGAYVFEQDAPTTHGADGTTNWADALQAASHTGSSAITDCESTGFTFTAPSTTRDLRLVLRACDDSTCTTSGWDVNTDDGGDPNGLTLSAEGGSLRSLADDDPLTVLVGGTYHPGDVVNVTVQARNLDGTNNTGQAGNLLVNVSTNGTKWLTDLAVLEDQGGLYYVHVRIPENPPEWGDYTVHARLTLSDDKVYPGAATFQVRYNATAALEAKLDILLGRLTADRALALDNLDETVSSRAAETTATDALHAARSTQEHLNTTTDPAIARANESLHDHKTRWNGTDWTDTDEIWTHGERTLTAGTNVTEDLATRTNLEDTEARLAGRVEGANTSIRDHRAEFNATDFTDENAVWSATSRSLTDRSGFALTSSERAAIRDGVAMRAQLEDAEANLSAQIGGVNTTAGTALTRDGFLARWAGEFQPARETLNATAGNVTHANATLHAAVDDAEAAAALALTNASFESWRAGGFSAHHDHEEGSARQSTLTKNHRDELKQMNTANDHLTTARSDGSVAVLALSLLNVLTLIATWRNARAPAPGKPAGTPRSAPTRGGGRE